MSAFLEKLNLRPHEQRLVVVVGAAVFLVLNLWFVWPHFKDLGLALDKLKTSQKTLVNYRTERALIPKYHGDLDKLKVEGSEVLSADQAIHFKRTVEDLARNNGVEITFSGPAVPVRGGNVNTNFFEELNMQLRVNSGEAALVDFLYTLGAGASMIRVRDMLLVPGPADPRAGGSTNLSVTLVLTASYQKAAPAAPKTQPKPKQASGAAGRGDRRT